MDKIFIGTNREPKWSIYHCIHSNRNKNFPFSPQPTKPEFENVNAMMPSLWFILIRLLSSIELNTLSLVFVSLKPHSPDHPTEIVVSNTSVTESLDNCTFLASRQKWTQLVPTPLTATISTCIYICLLTAQAGDAQKNPGPKCKFRCGICNKAGKHKDKGLGCDNCYVLYHANCIHMSNTIYRCLQNEPDDFTWICDSCCPPNYATLFFESTLSITSHENSNNYSYLS